MTAVPRDAHRADILSMVPERRSRIVAINLPLFSGVAFLRSATNTEKLPCSTPNAIRVGYVGTTLSCRMWVHFGEVWSGIPSCLNAHRRTIIIVGKFLQLRIADSGWMLHLWRVRSRRPRCLNLHRRTIIIRRDAHHAVIPPTSLRVLTFSEGSTCDVSIQVLILSTTHSAADTENPPSLTPVAFCALRRDRDLSWPRVTIHVPTRFINGRFLRHFSGSSSRLPTGRFLGHFPGRLP